ncbi:MAG: hypothetical protein HQL71_12765 [Magnetococcales bacterium]|nr:hypothetical protein [Magnetococcales bacterium]
MNRYLQFSVLLVTASFLGACASEVDTPWDRKALDPGQITTMKPLEIPPTFDELPQVSKKVVKEIKAKQKSADTPEIPSWISAKEQKEPDIVPELSLEQKLSGNGKGSIPRNEEEKLPSWIGPEKKSE